MIYTSRLCVHGDCLPVITNFLGSNICCVFSETTLAGCTTDHHYWTAGQRIDPNSESVFVWRVNADSDTVTVMKYTQWARGEPSGDSCLALWDQSTTRNWKDVPCNDQYCFVCEIDMNTWSNITAMRSNCSTLYHWLVANVLRTSVTA